jgi:micrococcal nuclease
MVCVPSFLFSQEVKVNVYDKFIRQQRIELQPLIIPSGNNENISLIFSSVASTFYLQLSGSGWGASTIDVDNAIIFLFSNDSTVTLRSIGLQTFEPGLTQSTYRHQYFINASEIESFSKYDLVGIRKYSFKDFKDLSIPKSFVPKIKNFGALFLRELKKANVLKTIKYITAKDVAKYVGDTVQFCSEVYSTRFYEGTKNKPTILVLRSNISEPLLTVLIPGADRQTFAGTPETIYADRRVCISGLVQLYNGAPQIVVHKREQIKVTSPITAGEALFFIGDSVTVIGKIFSGRYFMDSDDLPTQLNMGAPYPDQLLSIVIENKNRRYFVNNPEVVYLNKMVSVSGKIFLFKNKPQMIIHSSEQIKIMNDNATASTTAF